MPTVSETMVCYGCGASVSMDDKVCPYCGKKLTFTSIRDVRGSTAQDSIKFLKTFKDALANSPDHPGVQTSLGLVLFDRNQFDQAAQAFDKAINCGADESEVFYYAAVARFRGKKPFQFSINEAKHIVEMIDGAIMMNPLPQYFYAKSVVIKKLIEDKHMSYSTSSAQAQQEAMDAHLTDADIMDTNALLGI